MSIFLKGLKMPKGNNFVTIQVSGDGKWCDVWETELEGEAVEVPTPHGNLIDANAYLEKVCTYSKTGCGSCKLQTACPVNEPTVIEAEE